MDYKDVDTGRMVRSRSMSSAVPLMTLLFAFLAFVFSVVSFTQSRDASSSASSAQSAASSAQSTASSMSSILTSLSSGLVSSSALLPAKFAVSYLPSIRNQEQRGTCFVFATQGVLEHAYRLQGIAKGYLQPNEYVWFSEQAYGVGLLRYSKLQPQKFVGTHQFEGVLDDGYTVWLYAFNSQVNSLGPDAWSVPILPFSVCPYIPTEGHDDECPGYDAAILRNPIRISRIALRTLYGVSDIKRALIVKQHAMSFETELTAARHYLPCSGQWSSNPECASCSTPCPWPSSASAASCCVAVDVMTSVDGQFYLSGGENDYVGGHAMVVVGFNDEYVEPVGVDSPAGMTRGAFLLRNSWGPRSSHSIDYLMQRIGGNIERSICPNSQDPLNWIPCSPNQGNDNQKNQSTTVLQCSAATPFCTPNTSFCVINMTASTTDVGSVSVFLREWATPASSPSSCAQQVIPSTPGSFTEYSIPIIPLDVLGRTLQPVPACFRSNNPDVCGYYSFPYELYELTLQRLSWTWVGDFDIEFDDSAYLANAANYPQYDYSLLRQSTYTQTMNATAYVTPLPWLG